MTGQVTLGNEEARDLATPGRRLVARLIDMAIVLIVTIILAVVGIVSLLATAESSDEAAGALAVFGFGSIAVFVVVLLLYEPTMIALRGQTLGKMATNIMVVGIEDGAVPGWGKALGRWVLPGLLAFIPVIGGLLSLLVYISLLWDDRRQGWHDKLGTTVVVKV